MTSRHKDTDDGARHILTNIIEAMSSESFVMINKRTRFFSMFFACSGIMRCVVHRCNIGVL